MIGAQDQQMKGKKQDNAVDIATVQRLVSSAVWVVYYLYPTMVTHLLRMFHCTELIRGEGYPPTGTSFLYVDLAVECGSDEHDGVRTIAAVFLLVYVVAVPALILWVTERNRARLGDAGFRTMYGFFFVGYEAGSAWWEVVVLARKLALVAVSYTHLTLPTILLV